MNKLLPTLIEESEPLPTGVNLQDTQPLEAVAAIWSQNPNQVMGPSDIPTTHGDLATSETTSKNVDDVSMIPVFSDPNAAFFGLSTYTSALNDFAPLASDPAPANVKPGQGQCSMATATAQMGGFLQLGMMPVDLDSELTCTSVLPSTTLSFSELCAF